MDRRTVQLMVAKAALDTVLKLDPGADREAVLAAMNGHVLARGEVVGTFQPPQ
jgi:phosphatidylethanolamine-binding protein (PEBP) family uncharacterized protein